MNAVSAEIKVTGDWIVTNIDALDVTNAVDWHRLFKTNRLDNIIAEQVWEHLTKEQAILANQNCYNYLKKGGRLRLVVPDGNKPYKNYIEWVKVGGKGLGADDHKILYTYNTMKTKTEKAGFDVELLEYWHEKGNFPFTNWTNDEDLIRRSSRYDERNMDGSLAYISIIVDAKKKINWNHSAKP